MTQQNALNYSNIVSAVALQVVGHPAVARAVNVAQRFNAGVTLVHAFSSAPASEKLEPVGLMRGSTEGEARHQLELLKSQHPEVSQTKLLLGNKWSSLIDIADEAEADLIVIGSYVRGQLVSLMGSAPGSVVNDSTRDVLVVHSEAYDDHRQPGDFQHIMVAVDVNDGSRAALEKAIWLAREYDARLTLVNVIEHFPIDRETTDITPENQDPMQYQINLRRKKLQQMIEGVELPHGVDIEVLSTNHATKHAVPIFARERGVDLVVTGSHGQQGLQVLLGKTADGIIHNSLCDVLVVREA